MSGSMETLESLMAVVLENRAVAAAEKAAVEKEELLVSLEAEALKRYIANRYSGLQNIARAEADYQFLKMRHNPHIWT